VDIDIDWDRPRISLQVRSTQSGSEALKRIGDSTYFVGFNVSGPTPRTAFYERLLIDPCTAPKMEHLTTPILASYALGERLMVREKGEQPQHEHDD
jgi:hypothetical protein